MTFSRNKKIAIAILVFVVIVLGVYSFSKYSKGQGLVPFGGLVVNSFYCNGTNNFLLTVTGPAGGLYVYDPRTPQAYASFNLGFETGMWVLGMYTPFAFGCQIDAEPVKIVIPSLGVISPTVGTSPIF